MKRYRDIKLFDEDSPDLDVYMQEILERRKLEAEAMAEAGAAVTLEDNVEDNDED
jgi:hypothetical protein